MIRARTLIGLFVVSSLVTIGLNAAGAFDGDHVHETVRRKVVKMGAEVQESHSGRSSEMPVSLVRADGDRDEFAWAGIPHGRHTIEIRSLIGSITAVPATGDSVRVVAMREGDGRSNVQIRAINRDDRITLCAAHPSREDRDDTIGCGTAVLTANGRKQMKGDARVDFHVEVPAGIKLIARAVDGAIRIENVDGDVVASTVNGNVAVGTKGAADAETINGNVEARVGRLGSGENKFKTVHGNVVVLLPPETGAEVRAESVTGSVQTDLPVQAREVRRTRLTGTIGSGGPTIIAKTIAGDVQLKRTP